jgi:hypothetical protein
MNNNTLEIPADLQTKQLSRAQREQLAQIKRRENTPPNPLAGMDLKERKREREKRRLHAPEVRAQREEARAAAPLPLRDQVAELRSEIAELRAELRAAHEARKSK